MPVLVAYGAPKLGFSQSRAEKDDDGVLVELAVLQELNNFADLIVDKAASSEVCTAGADLC